MGLFSSSSAAIVQCIITFELITLEIQKSDSDCLKPHGSSVRALDNSFIELFRRPKRYV